MAYELTNYQFGGGFDTLGDMVSDMVSVWQFGGLVRLTFVNGLTRT